MLDNLSKRVNDGDGYTLNKWERSKVFFVVVVYSRMADKRRNDGVKKSPFGNHCGGG